MKKILVVSEGGGFAFETKCLLEKLENEFEIFFLVPQDRQKNREIQSENEFEIPKITSIYDKNLFHSAINFMICITRTVKILKHQKYDAIICIGSSVAVPLFIAGKICRVKCVFIESITRINDISLTTKLLLKLKICDRLYVQWKSLTFINKKLIYKGNVL